MGEERIPSVQVSRSPPMVLGASPGKTRMDQQETARLERLAAIVSRRPVPPWAAEVLKRGAPALELMVARAKEYGPTVYRYVQQYYSYYKKLPSKVLTILWGLALCFFGGRYPLLLASIESFKLTGCSEILRALRTLKENALAAQQAAALEDAPPQLEGGEPNAVATLGARQEPATGEVEEESTQSLERKVWLVIRSVDPQELSQAFGALWSSYLGLLATLRLKFARSTSLAHSIGENLRPAAARLLGPTVLALVRKEDRHWVSPGLNLLCKMVALSLAFKLQKGLSTVQSGVTGGLIAARAILALLQEKGLVGVKEEDTYADEVVGWSLAAAGIYVQLVRSGSGGVDLLLMPVLWPLSLLEDWLRWSATFLAGGGGGTETVGSGIGPGSVLGQ